MVGYWSLGVYLWANARARHSVAKYGTRAETLDLETIQVVVEIQVVLIKQFQGRVI